MHEMSDEERRLEEQRLADERLANDDALEQEQGLDEEQREVEPVVETGEQLQLPVDGERDFIPPLPPGDAHRPVEPVEIDPAAMPGTDMDGTPLDENGDPLPEPEVVEESLPEE